MQPLLLYKKNILYSFSSYLNDIDRPSGVGIGRIQRVCIRQTRFRLPQQPPGKAAVAPLLWDDAHQETAALA